MIVWAIGLNPNLIYILNELLVKFESQISWFGWWKDFLKMNKKVQFFGKFSGTVLEWIFWMTCWSPMVVRFLCVKLEEVINTWKLISLQDQVRRIYQKSSTRTRLEWQYFATAGKPTVHHFFSWPGMIKNFQKFFHSNIWMLPKFATGITWFGVRVNKLKMF